MKAGLKDNVDFPDYKLLSAYIKENILPTFQTVVNSNGDVVGMKHDLEEILEKTIARILERQEELGIALGPGNYHCRAIVGAGIGFQGFHLCNNCLESNRINKHI